MKIDHEFTVNVPVEQAWKLLTDLEGIAPCMPGAQLTGVNGNVYNGKVKIKVGPVVSEYAGTAEFVQKDDAAHRGVIDAKGRDSRGAGNASATIHAQLRPNGGSTVVNVSTDLNISGKIAQFGSGMISEVSQKLLGQFVQNLEAKLLADNAPALAAPASAPVASGSGTATTTATNGGAGPSVPAAPASQPAAALRTATEPSPGSPAASNGRGERTISGVEAEPLDLMSLAGRSVYKRLIPPVAALVVIVGVIVYFVAR